MTSGGGGTDERRDLAITIATVCGRLRLIETALLADTDPPSSANDVRDLAVATLALGLELIKYAADLEAR